MFRLSHVSKHTLNHVDTTNLIHTCILHIIQNCSTTKWLEGSENAVKETVAELKRLLQVELHNSIEPKQSLTEAIFPDDNLPINDNNGPQTTHSQN